MVSKRHYSTLPGDCEACWWAVNQPPNISSNNQSPERSFSSQTLLAFASIIARSIFISIGETVLYQVPLRSCQSIMSFECLYHRDSFDDPNFNSESVCHPLLNMSKDFGLCFTLWFLASCLLIFLSFLLFHYTSQHSLTFSSLLISFFCR